MKLTTILKQVLKEYELKKPENIYTPGSGPSSLNIKLKRTLNFSNEEKVIIGDTFEIDDTDTTPMLVVKSSDGKKLASVIYDKESDEFSEGETNFKYIYKPMSATANLLLKDLKNGNIDKLKKDAEEYKLSEINNSSLADILQVGDKIQKLNNKGLVTITKIDGDKVFVEDEKIPGRQFQWTAKGIEDEIKNGQLKLLTK